MSADVDLGALFAETQELVSDLFGNMETVDKAIYAAQQDRPDLADVLYHAFSLMLPTHPLMKTPFVYASHVAELLARVLDDKPWKRGAVGADTRPATYAEIACGISDVSLVAPMHGAGAGLYARVWARAFPDQPQPFGNELQHYERMHGYEMDELERACRAKALQPWRLIDSADCQGRHHGEPVTCRYAQPPTLFDEPEPARGPFKGGTVFPERGDR